MSGWLNSQWAGASGSASDSRFFSGLPTPVSSSIRRTQDRPGQPWNNDPVDSCNYEGLDGFDQHLLSRPISRFAHRTRVSELGESAYLSQNCVEQHEVSPVAAVARITPSVWAQPPLLARQYPTTSPQAVPAASGTWRNGIYGNLNREHASLRVDMQHSSNTGTRASLVGKGRSRQDEEGEVSTAYGAPHQDALLTPPSQTYGAPAPVYRGYDESPTLACQQRVFGRRQDNKPRLEQRQVAGLQNKMLDLSHAPPMASGIRLVNPRTALPDRLKNLFSFELFNAVQSKCFPLTFESNDNLVVSAPTGSGKTVILELAICRLLAQEQNQNFKIVYQAPTKALCFERAKDWEKKFSSINIHCAALTGDTSRVELAKVRSSTIIVTTPEKWDSITRKWEDHHRLVQLVKLFLIDEVHMLRDSRGATLEAVVSRMKTMRADVRFVALSATVPNSYDIATWLGRSHTQQHLPAHVETFGEEMRPVKLDKIVYGSASSSMNHFAFEQKLNTQLTQAIRTHSEGKPIMVFCFTRSSCQSTATLLANMWMSLPPREKTWPQPSLTITVENAALQDIVKFGVAFHHAGLGLSDRQTVERAFLDGQLSVICCTSTLAVGVNLPCHTVILKGTVGFANGHLQEYSDLEVMQMLGRAGRPQFDDTARSIILTTKENEDRYKQMLSGQEILESTLHQNLLSHLNSEIFLKTIKDLSTAKTWLHGTFLCVRMRQNPGYYGISHSRDMDLVDSKIEELCERDIGLLQTYRLVSPGTQLSSTDYGKAMARYMIDFDTMKALLEIPRGVEIRELLKALCRSPAFNYLRYTKAERPVFKELNKAGTVMFPVRDNLTDPWTKAFLLVQIALGCVELPKEVGYLKREWMASTKQVLELMQRFVRCVVDCKHSDNDAQGLRSALELSRSLEAKCWDGRPTVLSQIPGIGPVAMRKLASHGINSIQDFLDLEDTRLDQLLSRNPPHGRNLLKAMVGFPRLIMNASVIDKQLPKGSGRHAPSVTVKAVLGYSNNVVPMWPSSRVPLLTFVAETTDGVLRFYWKDSIRQIDSITGLELKFPVPVEHANDSIHLLFSCESIAGTAVSTVLEHSIPARLFPDPSAQQVDQNQNQGIVVDADSENFDDDALSDDELLDLLNPNHGFHCPQPSGAIYRPPTKSITEWPANNANNNIKARGYEKLVAADSGGLRTRSMANHDTDDDASQLANGRWKCNHPCSSGSKKNGKPCSHKCCHEGLDKPRARAKRKRAESPDQDQDELDPPQKIANSYNRVASLPQISQRLSMYPIPGIKNDGRRDYVDLTQLDSPSPPDTRSKACNATTHNGNRNEIVEINQAKSPRLREDFDICSVPISAGVGHPHSKQSSGSSDYGDEPFTADDLTDLPFLDDIAQGFTTSMESQKQTNGNSCTWLSLGSEDEECEGDDHDYGNTGCSVPDTFFLHSDSMKVSDENEETSKPCHHQQYEERVNEDLTATTDKEVAPEWMHSLEPWVRDLMMGSIELVD